MERNNPSFNRFMRESGFKVLALARLSQCEYSVVLYLSNCAVSGLDYFITTEAELASLIGYDETTLKATLGTLAGKNIIRLRYGDSTHDSASVRIGLQYDLSKWVLAYDVEATSRDAVVFPFRRLGQQANLVALDGSRQDRHERRAGEELPTWKRVFESFIAGHSLDDAELEQTEEAAHILVDTHPVDQVLLMIRHFGQRIPTLSLLASSWQHYQEIFEEETQKIDMLSAREKHTEFDQKVRDNAARVLEDNSDLTEEERTVLQILAKHRHPRRQLFWAYQLRSRYPNLTGFFTENVSLMLSVTSHGTVVKRHE